MRKPPAPIKPYHLVPHPSLPSCRCLAVLTDVGFHQLLRCFVVRPALRAVQQDGQPLAALRSGLRRFGCCCSCQLGRLPCSHTDSIAAAIALDMGLRQYCAVCANAITLHLSRGAFVAAAAAVVAAAAGLSRRCHQSRRRSGMAGGGWGRRAATAPARGAAGACGRRLSWQRCWRQAAPSLLALVLVNLPH